MNKRDFDYKKTMGVLEVTGQKDMLRCTKCGQMWSPIVVPQGEENYVGATVAQMLCPSGCNTPDGYDEALQAAEEKWRRETYPGFKASLDELKKDPTYKVMEEAEEFEVWVEEHKDESQEYVAGEMNAWLEENVAESFE